MKQSHINEKVECVLHPIPLKSMQLNEILASCKLKILEKSKIEFFYSMQGHFSKYILEKVKEK